MDLIQALVNFDFPSAPINTECWILKAKAKMQSCKRARDKNGRFASERDAKQVAKDLPAMQQVFETIELVENILLYLPMKDLLFSQKVCKSWKALAAMSPRIRRALFYEPIGDVAVSYIDWRLDDKGIYQGSPTGTRLGKPLRGKNGDGIPTTYPAHWGLTRDDDGVYRVHVNSLLATKFQILKTDGIFWPKRESEMLQSNPAMYYPHASWRHMFFTQPPIETITLECEGWIDPAGIEGWSLIPFSKKIEAKGLTMQQLWSQLTRVSRPSWILGRDLWESDDEDEWCGLKSVVKTRKKKARLVKRNKKVAKSLARRLMPN